MELSQNIGNIIKNISTKFWDTQHLPKAFSSITEDELFTFKCKVVEEKAVRAPSQKGLQIKITIEISLVKKKMLQIKTKLKKIKNCSLI